MRRITLWLLATISLIVLLISYPTSTNRVAAANTVISASAVASKSSAATGGSTPAAGSAGGSSGSSGSSATAGSAATSYTGTAVDTQYGPVQVKITVVGGKITVAEAVQYPESNGRDQEINAQAIPQLNSEVVAQQSASIDMVSGATYTSDGYAQSLQAAIDQANL